MLSHPLVVHAPLVLLPTAFVIWFIGWVSPWKQLKALGVVLLIGAALTGILAANLGEADEERVEDAQPWAETIPATGLTQTLGGDELLDAHAELGEMVRTFAIVLAVGSTALLVLERRFPVIAAKAAIPAFGLLAVVGAASIPFVIVTGHSGGALVHDHGVGVALSGAPAGQTDGVYENDEDDEDEDDD
jgi:uncharacterized membrane protein